MGLIVFKQLLIHCVKSIKIFLRWRIQLCMGGLQLCYNSHVILLKTETQKKFQKNKKIT